MQELTVTLILQVEDDFNVDEFLDKLPVAASLLDTHETTADEAFKLQKLIYQDDKH